MVLPSGGHFDGDGHSISNLQLDKKHLNFIGLFGNLKDGSVSSLHLVSIAQLYGGKYVGAITGYLQNGSIQGYSASGFKLEAIEHVGGIVGSAVDSTIDSCVNNISVELILGGSHKVGGIAGSSYITGAISSDIDIFKNCINNETVDCSNDDYDNCTGGIVA